MARKFFEIISHPEKVLLLMPSSNFETFSFSINQWILFNKLAFTTIQLFPGNHENSKSKRQLALIPLDLKRYFKRQWLSYYA
jgi:hypothetical protein